MKRIAIEASLANASCPTGLGVYVHKLLEGLAAEAPKQFHFYLLHAQKEWNGPNYGPHMEPVSYHFTNLQSLAILCRLNQTLEGLQADLFHATGTTGAPPHCRIPVISTIHDLYPLEKGADVSFRFRLFFRLLLPWTLKNSVCFLCNSEFTRDELLKHGVAKEKTRVIYPASQLEFSIPRGPSPTNGKPYYLCVGAIERRKGQAMLAEAYCLARKQNPSLPELLFIGPDRGDGRYLEQYEENSGIRWLHYVSVEELKAYYQNAALFLCPSIFEGFGIPVLEALNAGIPVLCSDLPVFREIAGEAACYVNPDRESFARRILDFAKRQVILDLGKNKKRSALFSWEKNVSQTLENYDIILYSKNSN